MIFLVASLFSPGANAADRPAEDVQLAAELGNGADSAEITCQKLAAIVAIKSKRGIGQLVLHRRSPQWPAKLTLHIGVYPLEGFTATCGNRQLEAGLRFHQQEFRGKVPVNQLADNNPHDAVAEQLPIVIAPQGQAAVVIEFPTELLDADEDKLHLHWVDAYR